MVSLTNLHLSFELCFYNEMDDYAKTWLQLMFPIYLIFIATLLIITSRYSTTIQRLTARRALPVLATLFLLSYTKVLLTVSNVLFSYTSITHLPSNHTTLVWSVDTSVPLFGVKFVVLFITSCVLFMLLVVFTVILTCSNILLRFRVLKYVTRFYRTDPNCTSGKIKLTPPMDSYTIVLQVLTLSTTQTTRGWFLHTSFLGGVECPNGGFRPCEGPGLARVSGLLVDSLIMLARHVPC